MPRPNTTEFETEGLAIMNAHLEPDEPKEEEVEEEEEAEEEDGEEE